MHAASDVEPAITAWRSTRPHQAEVVRLYQAGRSLTSISKEIGIAWESVARLLDRAGVREWKKNGR
jgi:transposase-like protein